MKKILALSLASALMFSVSAVALAEEMDEYGVMAIDTEATSETGSPDQVYQSEVTEMAQMDSLNVMYGTVTEIGENQIFVETYDQSEVIIFNIGDTTKLIDAATGAPLAAEIAVGDAVACYYEIMTMSLPAQAPAVAILANVPMDMGFPTVAHVGEAYTEVDAEGSKTLLTTANGNPVMLDETTIIAPFITKNIITAEDIAVGDLVCIWTSETFSDTPKTGAYMTQAQVAYQVVLLEAAEVVEDLANEDVTEEVTDQVIIGGADEETEIVVTDEAIALRATLENLGYNVDYDNGIITITKGDFTKTVDSIGNGEMTEIEGRIYVSQEYLASVVE